MKDSFRVVCSASDIGGRGCSGSNLNCCQLGIAREKVEETDEYEASLRPSGDERDSLPCFIPRDAVDSRARSNGRKDRADIILIVLLLYPGSGEWVY